jgi:hypothetical protein
MQSPMPSGNQNTAASRPAGKKCCQDDIIRDIKKKKQYLGYRTLSGQGALPLANRSSRDGLVEGEKRHDRLSLGVRNDIPL